MMEALGKAKAVFASVARGFRLRAVSPAFAGLEGLRHDRLVKTALNQR